MKTEAPQVDLSEFYKLSRPKKPPCKVGFARQQLTKAQREKFDAAVRVDQGIITNDAIVQWLASYGHETTVSAVVVHRKTVNGTATTGKCSCGDS